MRFIILFFLIFSLYAEKIDKYDVKVNVLEDGKLHIVENIFYDFTPNKRHGIFRYIPLNQNTIDINNIKRDNQNENYVSFIKNKILYIKIGNKDKVLEGKHLYTIDYILNRAVFSKDESHNAISLNVIGTGWKVYINNIKIDIFLPQKLQTAKLKVFSGKLGSTSSNVELKQLSATHYQIFKKSLAPHEGITFDIYFDKNLIEVKSLSNIWAYIYSIIFIIFLYRYYLKHKIPYVAVSPKYYPPKDLDILKVGLLIDQSADEKDISTAILELATKGYLKIQTIKESNFKLFTKEKVILKKLKDDKGLDEDIKILFNAIFARADEFILGEKDLTTARRLRKAISSINSWLYDWGVKNKYFKENPGSARFHFFIKPFLINLVVSGFAFYQTYHFYGSDIIVSILVVIIFMIGTYIFLKKNLLAKLFALVFIAIGIYISTSLEVALTPFTITSILFIILIYFTANVSAYTIKGINSLKYILGLKEFILKVEKDKLEFLLKENPNYLNQILPYAVLFGAKHWFDFYDEFNIDKNWYEGESIYFRELDQEIYTGFKETSNYSESNDTNIGGSFSGGGSTGGGSGGGGGGSW